MATVGKWYSRRIVSNSSPPGSPGAGYVLSGRPIFVPDSGKFYCVWYGPDGTVIIRELYGTTNVFLLASGTYSIALSGAFYLGGYIYILGASAASLGFYKVNVTSWTSTLICAVVAFTAMGNAASMAYDGTNAYFVVVNRVSYAYLPCRFHLYKNNLSASTPTYIGYNTIVGLTLTSVKMLGVLGANLYFSFLSSGIIYEWYSPTTPTTVPTGVASNFRFFGNPAYHQNPDLLVHNAGETLSWNLSERKVFAVIEDTTPKFIAYDGVNLYFYEGATLKSSLLDPSASTSLDVDPMLAMRPDAKEHQMKGLCWMKGGIWYELQPYGREIT